MKQNTHTFLQQACALSEKILRFQEPAHSVLSDFLNSQRLNKNQRFLLSETIFSIIRHLQKIKAFYGAKINAKEALIGGAFFAQTHEYSLWLWSEEDCQILAKWATWPMLSGSLNVQSELPLWLIDCLNPHWTHAEILAFGQSVTEQAPLDIRVNALKIKRDKLLNQLKNQGFQAIATEYSPWGIRLPDKPSLHHHPLFLEGMIEIQDEGSQILSLLTQAKRGEMVVDFCAGAGGKTLAIGAMMNNKGRLYALDVSQERLNRLKPRLLKSGLNNVTIQSIDHENDPKLARLYGKCDCVLIDAPCSGLGTLRRNPDLKYRQNPQSIAQLCTTQAAIFQAASKLVKTNGRLVYATCSILPEENQQQVNNFLENNPNFSLADCTGILPTGTIDTVQDKMLYLSTTGSNTDGFFAAVLIKHA